jgi:hypothetical protein
MAALDLLIPSKRVPPAPLGSRGRPRFWKRVALVVLTLLAVAAFAAFRAPAGPRTLTRFEPDRLAQLETDMWQAYYSQQRLRLFTLLVITLREQYGYSWARATQAGFHLARAASDFSRMRDNYAQVLPDLEAAYTIARDWTDSSFDPRAVARAELSWWVARRTPGQSDAESVGRSIADEYALLFSVPVARVSHAAALRAEAGHLRDEGGTHADWTRVHALLVDSYRALKTGVSPSTSTTTPPSTSN